MSVRTATFRIRVIAAPKPPEPPFVGVALEIEIDAENLTWGVADVSAAGITSMMARAFAECPSLTGTIRLPHVVAIAGKGEYLPFAGSPGLREVHFAAANEAAIRALVSFKDDPLLGAPNAVVAFDL